MMTTEAMQALETLSYTGIFLWFIVYNLLFFLPFPPYELLLLSLGYVSSIGIFNPFLVIIAIVLSSVVVDNIFFHFSKTGNKTMQTYVERLGKSTFLKYKRKLEEHYVKSFIILTFIPKVRLLGPLISGSIGVHWKRFLLVDIIANSVTCTFYVMLGYFFHNMLQSLMKELVIWEHALFSLIMLTLAALLFFLLRRHLSVRNGSQEKLKEPNKKNQ